MKSAKKISAVTKTSGQDAAAFLEAQHREVETLFKELEAVGDRALKTRGSTFAEIAHKLSCHAEIEEKIFYPAAKPVAADETLEAYEEHDVMKSLIAKIGETDPSDETYMAKCTVLKEVVEHHVEEEENEFFPKVRKKLGKEKMVELGAQLKAAFEELDQKPAEKPAQKMKPLKAAAIRSVK